MTNITNNQREVLFVKDSISKVPFALLGNSSDGSLGVNITSGSVTITGGATSANQTGGNQKTQIVDGSGNVIGATSNALDINIKSGNITGFATSAKQDTGNTSLASIDGKTPALGQAVATGSVPVVLTAAQLSTLTPLSSVTANAGTNLNTSLLALESGGNLATIAGAVSASKVNVNISSGSIANTSFIATQSTAASLNATVVGNGTFAVQAGQTGTWNIGTVTAVTAITNALPAGSNVIGHVIADSGSTTAVTQATASNLNATVVGTGTLATQVTSLVNPLVSAPLVGQTKIAITSTAVQLNGGTSQPLTNGIIITAPSGNVAPIAVGGSGVNNTTNGTGNGYLLVAGASVSFAVANTNDIWINGSANDYISWAGS